LEGTYNGHLVQLPDPFRADQKLKRVIKGIVQTPLKHWQASSGSNFTLDLPFLLLPLFLLFVKICSFHLFFFLLILSYFSPSQAGFLYYCWLVKYIYIWNN